MKTLYTIILMVCFSAFAKAEINTCDTEDITAVNWTGTYDTNFGQIILNQKGRYVVGTYRDLGAIRSYSFNGDILKIEFDNGKNTGFAKFIKTSTGFTGIWGWNSQMKDGNWNGKKVADAAQNYIQGLWKTTYQDLDFIDSKTGIMVAHYGNNGGMLWGKMNHVTDIFEGFYRQSAGAKTETCWFLFKPKTFEGKFNNRPRGSWNGWRPSASGVDTNSAGQAVAGTTPSNSTSSNVTYLKVTMNSVKHYLEPKRTKIKKSLFSAGAKMDIKGRAVPAKDGYYRSNLLMHPKKVHNETVKPNTYLIFEIPYPLESLSGNHRFVLNPKYEYDTPFKSDKDGQLRDINLREVLKYLRGVTEASDYPIAPNQDGRRQFTNSADTFWLETSGGKRIIRGYGDLRFFNGDFGFGYHYTIEIVNKW